MYISIPRQPDYRVGNPAPKTPESSGLPALLRPIPEIHAVYSVTWPVRGEIEAKVESIAKEPGLIDFVPSYSITNRDD